ncbi:PREDICTED: amyloid beta A4 precursor protein-binding family A member 2 [Myotis davidii]|uniref:amyloid beta A4 precursor protein-binding family A member 2 n=1 Tax=Myotis davidii TaxID=225400 RepID=UPI0007676C8E|nr:PREDICTED: amyloid beta A4 precursor protein-binding family A member 2 [Myotis davidii]
MLSLWHGLKTKGRTPEERPAWPPEQVCDGAEPRRQQRSDLNGPLDNNNVPETKKAASFPSFVAGKRRWTFSRVVCVMAKQVVLTWGPPAAPVERALCGVQVALGPGEVPAHVVTRGLQSPCRGVAVTPFSSSRPLTLRLLPCLGCPACCALLSLALGPCAHWGWPLPVPWAGGPSAGVWTPTRSNSAPPVSSPRCQRMQKAAKIKKKAHAEGDAQTLTEVDLFISTQRIKNSADTQETMMDHALRTISYIADIGNIVVLMARRRMPRAASQDCIETTPGAPEGKKQYKMICHVFESEDAQLIAQSIGQAFSVAYQEFLRANGINPEDLSQKDYSDIISSQEMYNDDLIHFSTWENCKSKPGSGLSPGVFAPGGGGGGSPGHLLPTVILANMLNGGPAARSGKLSIGDQIMSIDGTSLVGLPLATCQGIIKGLKNQTQVKLNIVSCPPVTTVLIKRPDLKYQLGFSVQNGIVSPLPGTR